LFAFLLKDHHPGPVLGDDGVVDLLGDSLQRREGRRHEREGHHEP
jgi:hypothetical protein